uniref:Uncharacterized protein n=1 Tax=Trieres chinensis TaxID=1514140 RepID=A0A7S2EWC0_TRICV
MSTTTTIAGAVPAIVGGRNAAASAALRSMSELGVAGLIGAGCVQNQSLTPSTIKALSSTTFSILLPLFLSTSIVTSASKYGLDLRQASVPLLAIAQCLLLYAITTQITLPIFGIDAHSEDGRGAAVCCSFGNSGVLPLIFCESLFRGRPDGAARSAANVSLYLAGWSPFFWAFGRGVLLGTDDDGGGGGGGGRRRRRRRRGDVRNRTRLRRRGLLAATASLLLLSLLPPPVSSKAILGVDLGSLYMKVALVQRNSPLEIVTNLHSKRKTEVMVLFDQGTRFFGADANSMVARKPLLTPSSLGVMLGRGHDHPTVKVLAERHYPITPTYNETRFGACLKIDGKEFTPEELVAMILSHAKDITAAFGVNTVKDCVLTVPSFYTQHERRALLDASALADLNVLALIDENTAAALHFGIDRIDEEPKTALFYNMGASALQVSVVRYFSYERKDSKFATKGKPVGAFEVLSKAWDATLGGSAFDSRLVDKMADEFNEIWNKKRNDGEVKDVRKYPRPMAKLRVQANKVKHVLSANNDMPVYIDSLHDDVSYQTHINRATFEEVCHDLLLRAGQPIKDALAAADMTLDDVDMVELIGGGMRVPRVQEEIQKVLGDKLELGLHINSDESMALGAAFHGANVSTAFRVRHVGMADVNPFPISITLNDLDGDAADAEEEADAEAEEGEGEEEEKEDGVWSKHATVFKAFGKIGVKKTIAFTHDRDVACAVDYEESAFLPPGSETSIERYNVTGIVAFASEMEGRGLAKPKVSLQFELSSSGLTRLIKAEAVVEEMVTITEEVEVKDDEEESEKKEEAASAAEGEAEGEKKEEEAAKEEDKKEDGEEKKEGDEAATEEKEGENKTEAEEAEEKPKKKTKTITKEKKKVHRRPLKVDTYHVGRVRPYNDAVMAESVAKLAALAQADKERMLLEEAKNKVESYIYHIKNTLVDDEENINAVTNDEQRAHVSKLAEEGEDWLYGDGYDADLATFEDKYAELSEPMEKIKSRVSEAQDRPAAVRALNKKLDKIVKLMTDWETSMPQVTEEERAGVLAKVEDVRKWVMDVEEKQAATDPWADPVFASADVPLQTKDIEKDVKKLSKKPKPKPEPVEEKKNDTEAADEEKKAEEGEEKKDEVEAEKEDGETESPDATTDESAKDEEDKGDGEL